MMFSAKTKILLLTTVLLTACSTFNTLTQDDKIDYKSTETERSKLDIPPDLTKPNDNRRYTVPNTGTASKYQNTVVENDSTLPEIAGVSIKREGTQRWLVINQKPEILWPILRQFWKDLGFTLIIDNPSTGIMETEWAENRAKLPQDIIRNTLGKLIDGLYSTSERDKFRIRVERSQDGGSEVYITHRGMQEMLVGAQKERTIWTKRPSDPGLEAEFLSRLMIRLGVKSEEAKAAIAQTTHPSKVTASTTAKATSHFTTVDGKPMLSIPKPVDHTWRLLGLALDRTNFTVEDRNRSKGIYFVRYVSDKDNDKKGFFDKLFSSNPKKQAQRYQIKLTAQNEDSSTIIVLNESDQVETSHVAQNILKLLDEQLR